MRKANIVRLIIYSTAIIIPILAMLNCSGWSTIDGKVSSCIIDGEIFREFANACYGFILLAVFMLGLPLILYFGVIVTTTEAMIFLTTKISIKLKQNK